MTQNEITKIAKEVGFSDEETDKCQLMFERFAYLVVQQEREACARVCEEYADDAHTGATCARVIRARGQA